MAMQTGAATMESIMEVPQKVKNKSTIWSSNPLLDIYPKETKMSTKKDICTTMFIAALFTIAKT